MDSLIHEPIQINVEEYEHLIKLAQRDNTSVSEITRRAIRRYLADEQPEWPTRPKGHQERMNSIETKQGAQR
jgi:hypothetical protein